MVPASLQVLYARHEKMLSPAAFLLGVILDLFTLGRIDSLTNLVQQAVYLGLVALALSLELRHQAGLFEPPRWLSKIWVYRDFIVHFILGSLLSAYTFFFFKSSSFLSSLTFVSLMVVLLVVNELERVRNMGATLRASMFYLCLASYFICVVPMVLGYVGVVPFLLAMAISGVLVALFCRYLQRKIQNASIVRRQALLPGVSVLVGFTALYFLQLVPPVPLSVSYMGIYHDIQKQDGQYRLSYTRPAWKVWQSGDQSFAARSGDAVYGFIRIFSPSRFKDQVQVRWLWKDPRQGWATQDVIPLPIVGGREEGYRGYTVKRSFQPGKWRLQVETADGREVGRLGFNIFEDPSTGERPMRVDIH